MQTLSEHRVTAFMGPSFDGEEISCQDLHTWRVSTLLPYMISYSPGECAQFADLFPPLYVCRFLQFGSPHSLGSQAQYVAAERDEIWVNIGYRLSAFGFLACDEPRVDGNFGFKDQWLALEWVQANIPSFGGTL